VSAAGGLGPRGGEGGGRGQSFGPASQNLERHKAQEKKMGIHAGLDTVCSHCDRVEGLCVSGGGGAGSDAGGVVCLCVCGGGAGK
jgi:hypothetical protein